MRRSASDMAHRAVALETVWFDPALPSAAPASSFPARKLSNRKPLSAEPNHRQQQRPATATVGASARKRVIQSASSRGRKTSSRASSAQRKRMAVRPLSASVLAGTSCVSDATRRVEYRPGKVRGSTSGGRATSGGRSGREQCSGGQQPTEQSPAGWAAQLEHTIKNDSSRLQQLQIWAVRTETLIEGVQKARKLMSNSAPKVAPTNKPQDPSTKPYSSPTRTLPEPNSTQHLDQMPSSATAPKLEHSELDAEIAWIARQVNTASDEELPASECSELVQQLMMLKQQQASIDPEIRYEIKRDSLEHIPIWQQANVRYLTHQSVRRREALRRDGFVMKQLEKIWNLIPKEYPHSSPDQSTPAQFASWVMKMADNHDVNRQLTITELQTFLKDHEFVAWLTHDMAQWKKFDLDKDGRLSMSELINATECFFEEVYHSSKAQVSAQVYAILARELHSWLMPGVIQDPSALIHQQWSLDSGGALFISKRALQLAIFELADLWCNQESAKEYVTFLHDLHAHVVRVGLFAAFVPKKPVVPKQVVTECEQQPEAVPAADQIPIAQQPEDLPEEPPPITAPRKRSTNPAEEETEPEPEIEPVIEEATQAEVSEEVAVLSRRSTAVSLMEEPDAGKRRQSTHGRLSAEERARMIVSIDPKHRATMVVRMSDEDRAAMIALMSDQNRVEMMDGMTDTDLVRLMSAMSEAERSALLHLMSAEQRAAMLAVMEPTRQVEFLGLLSLEDSVETLKSMTMQHRLSLLTGLQADKRLAFVANMTELEQLALLSEMTAADLTLLLVGWSPGQIAALIKALPSSLQARLFGAMPPKQRIVVLKLLSGALQEVLMGLLSAEDRAATLAAIAASRPRPATAVSSRRPKKRIEMDRRVAAVETRNEDYDRGLGYFNHDTWYMRGMDGPLARVQAMKTGPSTHKGCPSQWAGVTKDERAVLFKELVHSSDKRPLLMKLMKGGPRTLYEGVMMCKAV